MIGELPEVKVRFRLYIDDLSYLLPKNADLKQIGQQVTDAMLQGLKLTLTIETAGGVLTEAHFNFGNARVAYLSAQPTFGPPDVGKPG